MVPAPESTKLFTEALPLVQRAARRCRLSQQSTDWEDALQVGAEALWRATERFDASRGVPFRGYAWQRVLGAVKDWLEKEHEAICATDEDDEGITARPSESIQAVELDVEDQLIESMNLRRLQAALIKFSKPEREVVNATLARGSMLATFARRAGIPRTTCQWRLTSAVAALKAECCPPVVPRALATNESHS